MNDNPLDQFFGLQPNGELNFDKEIDKENKDVTGNTSTKDGGSDILAMNEFEVEFPEDAQLDDISRLALEAYKMQIENLQFIEPKFRNRYLEVAANYLNLARDSIKQSNELKQKDTKLDLDIVKADLGENVKEKLGKAKSNLYKIVKKKKNAA